MSEITPFEINISDDEIADLKQRLASTRWANKETVDDWEQGIPLSYVQEVCEYWQSEYDWKEREALLGAVAPYHPTFQGFDRFFGVPGSTDQHCVPAGWACRYDESWRPAAAPPSAASAARRHCLAGEPVEPSCDKQLRAAAAKELARMRRGEPDGLKLAAGPRGLMMSATGGIERGHIARCISMGSGTLSPSPANADAAVDMIAARPPSGRLPTATDR